MGNNAPISGSLVDWKSKPVRDKVLLKKKETFCKGPNSLCNANVYE